MSRRMWTARFSGPRWSGGCCRWRAWGRRGRSGARRFGCRGSSGAAVRGRAAGQRDRARRRGGRRRGAGAVRAARGRGARRGSRSRRRSRRSTIRRERRRRSRGCGRWRARGTISGSRSWGTTTRTDGGCGGWWRSCSVECRGSTRGCPAFPPVAALAAGRVCVVAPRSRATGPLPRRSSHPRLLAARGSVRECGTAPSAALLRDRRRATRRDASSRCA